MEKMLFALYDTEGYMKPLAEYFGKKNFLLESRLFTKRESLAEFLREHYPDVLLLGQEVDLSHLRDLDHAGRVIVMSEGNMVAENSTPYSLIFKYQSAEKILREIFQNLKEAGEAVPPALGGFQGQTEFLGIYRPYGDPLPIQDFVAGQGDGERKSLFVNMELLSGVSDGREGDERAGGLSELIFYLKRRSEKLAVKIRELVKEWEGVDYIYPVEDYRDLYSMGREDVDKLLSVLSGETDYERVVFDVGFLNDPALYLLYCCHRIYMPVARNSWEENQKNAFERLLDREGLGEMRNHICYGRSVNPRREIG